jgi:Flp pilus assembly protein TadG
MKGRRLISSEDGGVLVFTALVLLVLLAMAALAVDLGHMYLERQRLQNAADSSALAGAQELPGSASQAIYKAQECAGANHASISDFQATTPYNGDPGKIEARLSSQISLAFARVLGHEVANIRARAVAKATSGPPYVVYVNDRNGVGKSDPAKAFEISGSTGVISDGAIHSNTSIKIGGSDNTFDGPVTYCNNFYDGGSNNTYNPAPVKTTNQSMPFSYTFSDFPPTYYYTKDVDLSSRPELWENNDPDTNRLKTAVIVSTGDIQLSGSGVSGTVTLVAGDELKLSGSNFNLTACWNNILAFSAASHDSAIDISGSGGNWSGYIYCPTGRIKFQGSSNLSISGGLVTDRLYMSGSNFSLSGQVSGARSIRLVE